MWHAAMGPFPPKESRKQDRLKKKKKRKEIAKTPPSSGASRHVCVHVQAVSLASLKQHQSEAKDLFCPTLVPISCADSTAQAKIPLAPIGGAQSIPTRKLALLCHNKSLITFIIMASCQVCLHDTVTEVCLYVYVCKCVHMCACVHVGSPPLYRAPVNVW